MTPKEQANNRRSNHLLTFNGQTLNITQWAKKTGIKRSKICDRINRAGWEYSTDINNSIAKTTSINKGKEIYERYLDSLYGSQKLK